MPTPFSGLRMFQIIGGSFLVSICFWVLLDILISKNLSDFILGIQFHCDSCEWIFVYNYDNVNISV